MSAELSSLQASSVATRCLCGKMQQRIGDWCCLSFVSAALSCLPPVKSSMLFFRTWQRWPSRGGWAALIGGVCAEFVTERQGRAVFHSSLSASQGMFEPYLKSFYIRSTDPTQIKILKVTFLYALLCLYHLLYNLNNETSILSIPNHPNNSCAGMLLPWCIMSRDKESQRQGHQFKKKNLYNSDISWWLDHSGRLCQFDEFC